MTYQMFQTQLIIEIYNRGHAFQNKIYRIG